jgi:hypothetical protein
MTHPQPESNPLSNFLYHVRLAPRQAHKSLTLWPLVLGDDGTPAAGPEYVALGTALAQGAVQVDEIDESGAVPHVRVTNAGDPAVLFLFGEEIRGAKQNRVANASFLVPAKREIVIDVSCVEAGRWHRSRGARFESSDEVLSPSLRRKMAGKVTQARARGLGFYADQGEVWEQISERLHASGTASETQNYADYRESRATDLDELTQAFHPIEGQVGFVARIGDEVAGLEAIGRPDVFEADFRALLRSYAIDAVDAALVRKLEERPARGPHFETPEAFLAALAGAPFTSGPSLGVGDDLRIDGPEVAGCALAHEGLVHVTAFPAQG